MAEQSEAGQLSLFDSEPEPEPEPEPEYEQKKARNPNPQVWTVINGQEIPYSFRQSVINYVGKGHDPARIFYRAMASNAKDPIAWIRQGFKKPEEYAFKACRDEYDNSRAVKDWITDEWNQKRQVGGNGMESIRDILRKAVK